MRGTPPSSIQPPYLIECVVVVVVFSFGLPTTSHNHVHVCRRRHRHYVREGASHQEEAKKSGNLFGTIDDDGLLLLQTMDRNARPVVISEANRR